MINEFSRTELLLGEHGMEKLKSARVAVFGIGGVGGHAAEALVRSGLGEIDIIDSDIVSVTNINRQIIALLSTVGQKKVDVMERRLKDISPYIKVNKYDCFYLPETASEFDFSKYNYVIDAIDTVTGKIGLIMQANESGTPIISSMGAGNKLSPEGFKVADIYKTKCCPLAKIMRHELKKRGIKKLNVVYSEELPMKPLPSGEECSKRQVPGSVSFVPSVAGRIIAGKVVNDIVGWILPFLHFC